MPLFAKYIYLQKTTNAFYIDDNTCIPAKNTCVPANKHDKIHVSQHYKLNWARTTCWGWRDKWHDTALQTQDSKFEPCRSEAKMKWNESGFRPPLCTCRLNWARRTSWGWWDDWDDTVLQTQDSKFEPWRSEAEHATSRSRRLPTILTFTRGWGRRIFVSFKPPSPGTEPRTAWKAAVVTTTLGPPPRSEAWCRPHDGLMLEQLHNSVNVSSSPWFTYLFIYLLGFIYTNIYNNHINMQL